MHHKNPKALTLAQFCRKHYPLVYNEYKKYKAENLPLKPYRKEEGGGRTIDETRKDGQNHDVRG